MRFRYKITLCMVSLLAVFYAIGGTILISDSFRSSLEREQEGTRDSYQMLLDSLQLINQADTQKSEEAVSESLKQFFGQEKSSWAALCLRNGETVLYQDGTVSSYFQEHTEALQTGSCQISSFTDEAGRSYLQISGLVEMGDKRLTLDAAREITSIYETRVRQQATYGRIYLILLAVCLIVVYLIAYLLTRPLSKLSKATRRLASGNLSYRSMIRSNDEIGSLSQDFNQMAEQVEQSVEQMQETVDMQERFMGSFAHELKTPMTSIIGYADLIRRQTLDVREEAEAANYIYTEGRRLERLSYKMLELVSMERQELTLTCASPDALLQDMVQKLRPVYEKEGISLTYSGEAGVCMLETDLFHSLILNLMDNSRKALGHSGSGTITITLAMLPDGCRVGVSDDGPGVPEEDIRRLTEAFYRVDKARARSMGGVGLGLALCHQIAQLHQGTIRFQNREPHGLRVTVELRGGREA